MNIAKKFAAYTCMMVVGFACMSKAAFAEVVTHQMKGVSRVHFKLPGELDVRYGTEEKLTIEAPANVIPKLDVAVKGDMLVLGSKGSFKAEKELKFKLTIKSLRSLKSDGSGAVEIANFAGNDMDIDASGSGGMALKNLKPGRLVVVIKGSSDVSVSGSAKSIVARIEGSGSIDAAGFRTQHAEATLNGSGDIKVHADETLKAAINGAGNIAYKGKAKVTQSISGAGSVDRI
ncbi:MAG: DUF2807 domain-containing protein [Burkholderiales bacterium]|nr:DUF2807 domain-containing protein [Burkholderiales bacterium]